MTTPSHQPPRRMSPARRRKRRLLTPKRKRDFGVALLFLLGVLPGLYAMWTRTNWKKHTKIAVSMVACAALLLLVLPTTDPPKRATGGIVLIGSQVEAEIFGPEAPADREVVEVYTPVRTPIVVESTKEPDPIYVYCNNGGRYYHSEECRYVKENTPVATLTQALNAGYTRCAECSAPDGMGY